MTKEEKLDKIKEILNNHIQYDPIPNTEGYLVEDQIPFIADDILGLCFADVVGTLSETKVIKDLLDKLIGLINIVECCGLGPITNENYCPKCGSKIIR